MIKKLFILFLMAVMISSLAGCSGGSYRITIGGIDSSQNAISGNYHSFSGYYFKKVSLKVGENLTVTFSVQTLKGKLTAKVMDDNGKMIKTLNAGDTVQITEPGQYKLQVEGQKHKGSFLLSWEIK